MSEIVAVTNLAMRLVGLWNCFVEGCGRVFSCGLLRFSAFLPWTALVQQGQAPLRMPFVSLVSDHCLKNSVHHVFSS